MSVSTFLQLVVTSPVTGPSYNNADQSHEILISLKVLWGGDTTDTIHRTYEEMFDFQCKVWTCLRLSCMSNQKCFETTCQLWEGDL